MINSPWRRQMRLTYGSDFFETHLAGESLCLLQILLRHVEFATGRKMRLAFLEPLCGGRTSGMTYTSTVWSSGTSGLCSRES